MISACIALSGLALLARVGVIRLVASLLAGGRKGPGRHLVRLITRGTPADSGSVSSPWFFALPAEEKAMARVFWTQPKFALTIASQLENLPVSARQVAEVGAFPLVNRHPARATIRSCRRNPTW